MACVDAFVDTLIGYTRVCSPDLFSFWMWVKYCYGVIRDNPTGDAFSLEDLFDDYESPITLSTFGGPIFGNSILSL